MFSNTKSNTRQSPSKSSATYEARGSGGLMTRTDVQEPSCPACCLTPIKFFRVSTHLIKLMEVGLGGVCWYLLWFCGKE